MKFTIPFGNLFAERKTKQLKNDSNSFNQIGWISRQKKLSKLEENYFKYNSIYYVKVFSWSFV